MSNYSMMDLGDELNKKFDTLVHDCLNANMFDQALYKEKEVNEDCVMRMEKV